MKILFIHADYVNYEANEKTPVAEEIDKAQKAKEMEEPLIAFISVEKRDENLEDREILVDEAFEEIKDVASRIKVKNIAMFPFAHLTEDLASPDFAISFLQSLESRLDQSDFDSFRAPFGWYKKFEFRSKGHPLSVLSRSLSP